MLYLDSFTFPTGERETVFLSKNPKTERLCYDSFYPFSVLSLHRLTRLDFEPVTILYGGNGSGKSTALNVIAEKTKVRRESVFNNTAFFPDYLAMCEIPLTAGIPRHSRIIASDDVFDYMLNIRSLNDGADQNRETLFKEYRKLKFSPEYYGFQLKSLDDYDEFKRVNEVKRKTQSRLVRDETPGNVRVFSNGENAYRYFIEKITEGGLYILDEPENSLSPKRQIELAGFLEDSVRFYECQFIISTHSPFFLAIKGAKIYDLDEDPVDVKPWTELENVRVYYDFFRKHNNEF